MNLWKILTYFQEADYITQTISELNKFEETIDGPEGEKEFQFN